MGSAVCLLSINAFSGNVYAIDRPPEPGFLEFLGETLELEQLGVNIDQLIEQRLLAQNVKKQSQENTEESKQ